MAILARSIADRIYRAEIAITGLGSDPEIISALEAFGYNEAKRISGADLLARANSILFAVQEARAAQLAATQAVKDAEKLARTAYADLATVARTVLKGNHAALAALNLDKGPAPKGTATFLLAADKLFAGALSAQNSTKDVLAGVGYNTAKIESEQAKITALHSANQAQEQAKGTAQNLTPEQHSTLAELDSYVSQLRKLARIALRSKPQLLEKLGIKA